MVYIATTSRIPNDVRTRHIKCDLDTTKTAKSCKQGVATASTEVIMCAENRTYLGGESKGKVAHLGLVQPRTAMKVERGGEKVTLHVGVCHGGTLCVCCAMLQRNIKRKGAIGLPVPKIPRTITFPK